MSQSNQLLNKNFNLRGEYLATVALPDGDLRFSRVSGVNARFAMEEDTLEHVIMGQRQVVDRETDSISATLTLGFHEAISPLAIDLFYSQGVAPVIDTAYRLRNQRTMRALYNTEKHYLEAPYGLPQQFTTAEFPQPTSVSGEDTGASGTISAGTYYAFAVPLYADTDSERAWTVDLTTLAAKVRGVDYVLGTPSAASAAITAAGSKGMTVTFTPPSPPAGMPAPTHYLIVVGSSADITTGKICAVYTVGAVPPSAPTPVTFTAIGATSFGTAPALGDLLRVETIAVSGSARVYSVLTSGTDYTYNAATGTVALTASGAASHSGKGFRISAWFIASPSLAQAIGSSNTTERVLPVRLFSLHGSNANVNTRRPYGAEVLIKEVDFARLPDELLTSPGRRYHTPKTVTLPANWDPTLGAIGTFTAFAPDFASLINWYGSSISAG